jgi:hypothetical protein
MYNLYRYALSNQITGYHKLENYKIKKIRLEKAEENENTNIF